MTVLIVEDLDLLRRLYVDTISSEGETAMAVASYEEALSAAERGVSLVITDLELFGRKSSPAASLDPTSAFPMRSASLSSVISPSIRASRCRNSRLVAAILNCLVTPICPFRPPRSLIGSRRTFRLLWFVGEL